MSLSRSKKSRRPTRKVRIALIQMKPVSNPDTNLTHAVQMVRSAARRGVQIICLPELYRSLYFPQQQNCDVRGFIEPIPGPSTKAFKSIAKEFGVVIIVPVYEKAKSGRLFNSAVVITEKGTVLPPYRKLHIPHDPGFYEKDYFEEGNAGYKVYKTSFAKIAVLICFDQWFPEAARVARLAGAEIIFYPTAIGDWVGFTPLYGQDWHDSWETIQRSHSIANSVVVAAVNRVGVEGKTRFWGQSFITDAFGKVLQRGSKAKEEIVMATVDLDMNAFITDNWGFLRNRRPDTYKDITSTKLVKKSKNITNYANFEIEQKFLKQ